jgi:hypothetical protein
MNSSSALALGVPFAPALVGALDFLPQPAKPRATIANTHIFHAKYLNAGFIAGDDKKPPRQRQPKVVSLGRAALIAYKPAYAL